MYVYKMYVDGDSIDDIEIVTVHPELNHKGEVKIASLLDNRYTLVPEAHSEIKFVDSDCHEFEVYLGFTEPLTLEDCDADGWWAWRA